MAERLDVSARLAEGREAVQHTQTYVSACRARGYQHPDLTAHGTQVHSWYDDDDGMNLRLLDGDCTQLRAVVGAAEEALRVQRAQLDEIAAAWRGPGADSAAEFLQRHCHAGETVTGGMRSAAEACETLRDELWRLIDDKVNAAVSLDDRAAAQRPVWLAAAHTVTAGSGDRQAEDIVDQQVTPYVDTNIGTDWLAAMRSARGSVTAAYDAAAAAAAPGPRMVFAIPGELGPRYEPDDPAGAARVVQVAPAAAAAPPGEPPPGAGVPAAPARADPVPPAAASPVDPEPVSPADPLSATTPAEAAGLPEDAGWPSGAGFPGGDGLPTGGLPTGGGGLGGLIPRIVDAISSLLGSPDDGAIDPGLDEPFAEPFDEEPDDAQLVDDIEPEPGDQGEEPGDEGEQPDDGGDDPNGPEPEEPTDEVAGDVPTDDAVAAATDQQEAPPPSDEAVPQADNVERTPCEIAADELPQAGQ